MKVVGRAAPERFVKVGQIERKMGGSPPGAYEHPKKKAERAGKGMFSG